MSWERLRHAVMLTRPSALKQAVRELEEAQRESLTAAASREEWVAAEAVYKARVIRLRATIKQLSEGEGNEL